MKENHKEKALHKAKKIGFGPYGGKFFHELKGKERDKAVQEARERMQSDAALWHHKDPMVRLANQINKK